MKRKEKLFTSIELQCTHIDLKLISFIESLFFQRMLFAVYSSFCENAFKCAYRYKTGVYTKNASISFSVELHAQISNEIDVCIITNMQFSF